MRKSTSADVVSLFEKIGSQLKSPSKMTVIGSVVCLLHGMQERVTEDIDIWMPESDIDMSDFSSACDNIGVKLDPKDYVSDGFYFQLVYPGIVQIPVVTPLIQLFACKNLKVYHPPIEGIIASKLTRASTTDLQDCKFLKETFNLKQDVIISACNKLQGMARENAIENLILLEF